MGCTGTKTGKPDSKLNSPQNRSSNHAVQSVNLAHAPPIQETEKIEADYIFHALDPLVTSRNYLKKIVSKSNNASRIAKVFNCLTLSVSEKQELERNINQLMQIKHLNLISTLSYYYNDNRLYLIQEFCEGGNLLSQLDKFSQLQQYTMIDVFCQIMAGLQHLHNQGMVHGNIQLDSILFTNKSMENIKLIDFGISNQMKTLCMSWKPSGSIQEISFKPPEVFKQLTMNTPLTQKADIWSSGCLLYFFLTSHMPFQGRDTQAVKTAIQRGVVNFDGSEWANINPDMKQLVSKMLSSNPQQRPTATEVINHSIFQNRTRIVTKPNKQLSKHMRDFKQQSQMQNAMLNYIAENMMSEQDKKKLMDEFQKFDLNKDGLLTKDELLKVYCTMFSSDQAAQEVDAIFAKIDQNGSGRIDYQEFIMATIDQKKYFNREKLLLLFQQIDRDHSGQLSKLEVKKLLRDMQIPKEKLENLSKQLDQNGDGQITQEEFLQIMLQLS
ncbi:unnamed protein product (macronuclear) [Paramecium tetraurelia]|uniref:Protein kinase domain containing protein n=1 Tax=Paramecium tetraurelia TaxID=5888 RepID=A0DAE4_PARTE|nr:uncharacterized protein GSPATT00014918001 [Paramecium tetraurelia]CAK80011.1 unnamed protein product [Paramecium tetraurelia]|eukprot:XP_001447408.1 hypothetical protein (macronuclear) [Paramecium tetraurelia strain d4-2]